MVNANVFDNELRPFVLEALDRARSVCVDPSSPQPDRLRQGSSPSFCAETWSAVLDNAAGLLHQATTKFSLAANAASSLSSRSPQAAASSVRQPVQGLRTHLFQTVDSLEALPPSQGKTLYREARSLVKELLLNSAALVNSFLLAPVREDALERHSSALCGAGVVLAGVRAVKKLPRTNRCAFARQWHKLEGLVADAVSEFSQELEDLARQESDGDASKRTVGWDDDCEESDGERAGVEDEEGRAAGYVGGEQSETLSAENVTQQPEPSLEEQLAAGKDVLDLLKLTRDLFKEVSKRSWPAGGPPPVASSSSESSMRWLPSDSEQDSDDVSAREVGARDSAEVIALQDEVLRLGSDLTSKVDDLVFHFDGVSAAAVPPVSHRCPPSPTAACFAGHVKAFGSGFNELARAAQKLCSSSQAGSPPTADQEAWFENCRNRFALSSARWS